MIDKRVTRKILKVRKQIAKCKGIETYKIKKLENLIKDIEKRVKNLEK